MTETKFWRGMQVQTVYTAIKNQIYKSANVQNCKEYGPRMRKDVASLSESENTLYNASSQSGSRREVTRARHAVT